MDVETIASEISPENLLGELRYLWKVARDEASLLPGLRNPVSSCTDQYQRRLADAAIVLLSRFGVTAVLVDNRGYSCVRINGVEISY